MTSDGKKALIVFEGPNDKKQFCHLAKTFSRFLEEGSYETTVFGTSIYELYEPLILNRDFDSLPAYLQAKKLLTFPSGTRPQDYFSLIYLVFDFDPCYHLFDPEKIKALQSYFSDETISGLLYINYPMVEALFDFKKDKGSYQITKEFPLSLCKSEDYKKHVKDDTDFVSPISHHAFKYLPPKPFAAVSLLSMERYYGILGIKEEVHWTFSNQALLLELESQAVSRHKVYPLSCFPFMALDYNAQEALTIWHSFLSGSENNISLD
jgi:hypothetical protein